MGTDTPIAALSEKTVGSLARAARRCGRAVPAVVRGGVGRGGLRGPGGRVKLWSGKDGTPLPAVDDVYIALGTTIKVAGSESAFRAVDLPIEAIRPALSGDEGAEFFRGAAHRHNTLFD